MVGVQVLRGEICMQLRGSWDVATGLTGLTGPTGKPRGAEEVRRWWSGGNTVQGGDDDRYQRE